jgi:hypothetical protein
MYAHRTASSAFKGYRMYTGINVHFIQQHDVRLSNDRRHPRAGGDPVPIRGARNFWIPACAGMM